MRILQIIDSLAAGGAERMAVNYANALTTKVEFSGLIATRLEGPLLQQLKANVTYHFLNKKGSFDLKAVFRLKAFVKLHKITIIQAHSTSFFTGFLLKLICPSVQLIWHDHYGDSEFLHKRPIKILKIVLPFFSGVISVNQKLKHWAKEQMHFNNTIYLPNFTSDENTTQGKTVLKGIEGKRIVCLANLREQKNHFLLIEVANKLKVSHPDWTFHLVGKDNQDAYSTALKNSISELGLEDTVFIYGAKSDIFTVLQQSTIGILTSQSEGLPVALLEYGLHKMPVVVTAVGEINSVIQNGVNGCMVPSQESELFYIALIQLIENENLRIQLGDSLYQTVLETYSEQAVIIPYLNWLQTTILK
ncbi:glycosyltransferase [Flavobacterium sp. WC2429]|uniref:Glycosyltransferase n=1 Tax=Flavobacterium sp. WC2429 TaxID=3234140 RepID=A0AB39WMH5_9FLAO